MRTDSITGKQISEGYCFNDGEFYCENIEDARNYAKELGYSTLSEAYEEEAYYWTTWED